MIWNVGLAACSTLILGCVCLLGASAGGGCTGGGFCPRGGSSVKLTESIMLTGVLEGWDTAEAGRTPGPGSFDGGSGASSAAELSPKGPSGSVESSTASSLVTCALTLRGPLGPRRTSDREVVGAVSCVAGWLGAVAGSVEPTIRSSARRES